MGCYSDRTLGRKQLQRPLSLNLECCVGLAHREGLGEPWDICRSTRAKTDALPIWEPHSSAEGMACTLGAYMSGNSRLSCSMCVLASARDIHNGAKHNLTTWLELALMERQSGWSFQQGRWLSALDIDLLKQIQASKRLSETLYELHLVKRWNFLFMITLLRTTPLAVSALWQNQALEAIATIVSGKKVGMGSESICDIAR